MAEVIVLGMACLMPWAFGGVPAWAQLALCGGITIVSVLVVFADGTTSRGRRLFCLPSVGLMGLIFLGLFQTAPLPEGLMRLISPGWASLRSTLLPPGPERVLGDSASVVPLPEPRLSQDPDATIQTVAVLLATWLLFQGVLGLGNSVGVLRRLAIALSLNATLLTLFSIVQALTWNGAIYWTYPSPTAGWSGGGPFVCHTHLAEYLNMGLGLTLGLVVPGSWRELVRGKSHRLWAAYATAVIVTGIVASNSRGGFLAMLASGSVLALLLRRYALRLGIGAVAILAMVVVVLASLGDDSPYLGRIATIIDPGDGGYSIRMEAWRGAVRAWWDYPIWGAGLGSFPEAIAPYLVRERPNFFARAENEYVDLLTEGGLVGIALLLVFGFGVIRLAWCAAVAAEDVHERGLVLGAVFGVLAVGFNSMSDFGPHVPGVGVPAIILIATLCRKGLAVERSPNEVPAPSLRPARLGWALFGTANIALGMILVLNDFTNTRVEARLREAALPLPTESTPGMNDFGRSETQLERQRQALVAVLQLRPGWTDGHLRLGMLHLTLYEKLAAEWLRDSGNAADSAQAADPLWLFKVVHEASRTGGRPVASDVLLDQEPVQRHLLPAARSFLEARRSCPVSATAQVHLASLDFLLIGGDSASTYVARTLRLAGSSGATLAFAADIATRAGDPSLAARCWKRSLEVGPSGWLLVAEAASEMLSPQQLLEDVIPNGQLAIRFADRLYPDTDKGPIRERFLRTAAQRLPSDRDLDPAERLQLEATVWAALNESNLARERMEAALALKPDRDEWRRDLINWLLRWNQFEEAHSQAKVWLYFAPENKVARETLELTADALVRQESKL